MTRKPEYNALPAFLNHPGDCVMAALSHSVSLKCGSYKPLGVFLA